MGLFRSGYNVARLYLESKKRQFQESGTPNTRVDSGGNIERHRWRGQEIDRDELRDVKTIRESGGVVSHLVHAKALMQFGTGVAFESDEEEVAEWLRDEFNDIDNLLIALGEDALWYPYSLAEIVETRGGEFSHVECVEPWTMLPRTDAHGEIQRWEQEISGDFGSEIQRFETDEIASFVLNKSSGRDKTGVSEVLRAREEIEGYRQNAHAINNAVENAAWPRFHWTVGREDGGIIDDNELRRVRNRVDDLDEDTAFVTGPHVNAEMLEAQKFEFDKITEHDLRKLALALGLPLELANVGSDGLGSGMPAELRLTLFERQARAAQRALADQFVQQVIRPVLEEYSPYPSDVNVELRFGDPIEEEERGLTDKAPYMRLNEIREELDLPPEDDPELQDTYRKPANVQAPEEEEPEDGGGIGGLFGSHKRGRTLAEIADKYTEGTGLSEDDFVPNESIRDVIDPTLEFIDEHGLPNPEDQREGAARINQLKDHIENNEPLAAEFWQEILNFHKRHRAQGNDQCDESDLPEEATEIDNSQFDKCHFDAGWFSDRTWGGDPAFEQAERIVNAIEGTEGVELSRANSASIWFSEGEEGNEQLADGTPEWDQQFLDLHGRIWNEETDRNLLQFDDHDVPEFVKERLVDAIRGGAVFSDIESIPSSELMQLRQFLVEELEDERWNIDGIANRLQDLDADLSFDQAETIARTEVASAVNTAREEGYQERGQGDDVFKWVGVSDSRTTEACNWLLDQTNPEHGGEPVSLERLKELIAEAPTHDPDMQNDLARPENFVVHPNERKTFVRVVE